MSAIPDVGTDGVATFSLGATAEGAFNAGRTILQSQQDVQLEQNDSAATIKNRVTFIESAVTEGRARGNGQMPAGLLDGQDEQNVAAFVAKAAGR